MIKSFKVLLFATLAFSSYVQAQTLEANAYSYRSKYFQTRLTPDECGQVVQQVALTSADKSTDQQLIALLQTVAVECGIDTTEPSISFPAVMYTFANSSLKILWDGQFVSVNHRAEANAQYTMPQGFKNVVRVNITQQYGYSKGSSLMGKFVTKLGDIEQNIELIQESGETYLIVSGYAYHDRGTYTEEKVKELNERAWGVGFERVLFNKNEHRESVSIMMISDSHADPQLSASYEIQKSLSLGRYAKIWGGVGAGFVMRSDFRYLPVPFAFPTIGLSVGKINIKTVIIPKLGGGINHGNVVFFFTSYKL